MLPGVVTLLIIVLLAPLEFQMLDLIDRFVFAFLFGGVASLSVWVVVGLVQKLFPAFEEKWTVGKEICLVVVVIMTISILIFLIFYWFDLTTLGYFELFRSVFINTIIISILPIIILVLFEQYNHQKKQWKQAQSINKRLDRKAMTQDQLIAFKSENGKLELQLKAEEVFFLKSEGNYVEVFFKDQSITKKLIRNRLKALLDVLPEEHFFHCHKSYVVNQQHIINVDGNARNFELSLRGINEKIPVARSKSEQLIQLLSNHQSQ